MRFAFTCSTMGFGLPSFDDFIDSLPEDIAKQELLDWRQQASKAFKNRNDLALKGWLQAAYSNWRIRLTVDDIRPTLSMGLDYSKSQSDKNKKMLEKRWALTDDGLRIADIIEKLALSVEHSGETAEGLWSYFYRKLEDLHLNPDEQIHTNDKSERDPLLPNPGDQVKSGNWKKNIITYDTQNGRTSITGKTFANVVSQHRSQKKSR